MKFFSLKDKTNQFTFILFKTYIIKIIHKSIPVQPRILHVELRYIVLKLYMRFSYNYVDRSFFFNDLVDPSGPPVAIQGVPSLSCTPKSGTPGGNPYIIQEYIENILLEYNWSPHKPLADIIGMNGSGRTPRKQSRGSQGSPAPPNQAPQVETRTSAPAIYKNILLIYNWSHDNILTNPLNLWRI